MQSLFGIETEYGITVEGKDKVDVITESIAIIQSYTQKDTALKWDYSLEDPYLDARGFRAEELLEDTDEEGEPDPRAQTGLTWQEIKSDLVLSNGARYYNDHAHPEYSTPECSTLEEIVAHDRAGEIILWTSAQRRNREIAPLAVRLYKNNTDFLGHSYGCHDNYLVSRQIPFRDLAAGMIPFLVTRQIFAGAGKIGIETETHQMLERGAFQISQRSDFFAVLLSIDTMRQRPIINTRDEPHADPRLYRRFHVIIGDANMNSFATAMKIGTTKLALDLIEANCQPSIALADPVYCLQSISRDSSHKWVVPLEDGRTISAIDIQRLYLAAARKHLPLETEEQKKLLSEWERILDDLERDPTKCADRVDWASKKFLLEAMVEDQGLSWSDPWLQSIDLEYHNVDPDHGLYYALEREGRVKGWGSAHLAQKAVLEPPRSTRAYFRGLCVRKFGKEMSSVQWDEVEFLVRGKKRRIGLEELFAPDQILLYNSLIDKAESPENLLKELEKL